MIRMRLPNIQPGDILALPLANPQQPEKTLLKSTTSLEQRILRLLERVHFRSLWLHLGDTEHILAPVTGAMLESYQSLLGLTTKTFFHTRKAGANRDDLEALRDAMRIYVTRLIKSPCVFSPVDDIRVERSQHVLFGGTTCHLALLMGLHAHEAIFDDGTRPENHLNEYIALGLGALLHELGCAKLRADLLHKETWDLSQRDTEELQSYPVRSYRMLAGTLGERVGHIALCHRLHVDGSGPPLNVAETGVDVANEESIHLFARIVCLARAYVEMILRQDYRPIEALEELNCARSVQFDSVALQALNAVVPPFGLGETVTLSSGHSGVVSEFHPDTPFRPTVQILWDKSGDVVPAAQRVTLALPSYPSATVTRYQGRTVDYLLPETPDAGWEEMA